MRLFATNDAAAAKPAPLWGLRGSCARVAFTWTVSGGIAWGGIVVGVLTVFGAVSSGFQLLAAPVLFLMGLVFFIKWLIRSTGNGQAGGGSSRALEILRERYARGELDRVEFEAMKMNLSE
jgi:putative membrane protein